MLSDTARRYVRGLLPALTGLLAASAVTLGSQSTAMPDSATEPGSPPEQDRFDQVADILGVRPIDIVRLPIDSKAGEPVATLVPIRGEIRVVALFPYSVRSEKYEVLVQQPDGTIVPHEAGPIHTLRGDVLGSSESQVAGSLLDDGLHARIDVDGEVYWLEPIADRVPGALQDEYIIYQSKDVAETGATCGTGGLLGQEIQHFDLGNSLPDDSLPIAGSGICIAELACDADTEYYNDYGTVANVEARINTVINTVNIQYESQVALTHQITTIIVRTGNDPYTNTDAQQRLCQFITEWTNNQAAIPRDVAHLFTGAELNSSTIGIASDIGGTGICVNSGGCSGGTYGTFGSYCLSQSDFNGNLSCATDLTAHELGHLWGAFHCSCSGNTMNASITCANSFSQGTVNSIINYRNTRACLDGSCGIPPGPDNDNCADAEVFNGGAGDGAVAFNTLGATTDGPANPTGQCNDSGQNQTHNDIWYTYVAACSGTLTVTTCDDIHGQGDPSYDTDLAVYGPYASAGAIDCGLSSLSANLAGCNDDDPGNPCGTAAPWSSTVEINATQGQTYLIRVGGWSSADAGNGVLEITCSGGVANGACCFGDGTCTDGTAADCSSQGGAYQGDGTSCASTNCPIANGACCFGDGTCTDGTITDCSSQGGTYQGDGTVCASTNCPLPTGACCFDDGTCLEETGADCGSMGGTYEGDGVTCAAANCPQPTGACCFGDGTCSDQTQADCSGLGGSWQGAGTLCGTGSCPTSVPNVATSDFATPQGSIQAGSYLDTHTSNDTYEVLRERRTGGNPANRRSILDHTWTFNVISGNTYSFSVEAHHDANSEGDDFEFSYSLDNVNFTSMFVVTKTSDDDSVEVYDFLADVSGTVYVRVRDLDQAPGNGQIDQLYVDSMVITTGSDGPDTIPPAPPVGLSAVGGNGFVDLDWSDSPAPDLAGYFVYRSTETGGPYSDVSGQLAASQFTDNGLTNGTTYFYVVTAIDDSGNDSDGSNEAAATPNAPGSGPTTMSVSSILAIVQNEGGGNKRGRAEVTIVDNEGAPVAGATVLGSFSGSYSEIVSAATNASGVAVLLTSNTERGGIAFTFCVDNVTDASLAYQSADNVETCDTN